MSKFYISVILTVISIFLWNISLNVTDGLRVNVNVTEEYQKMDSINNVLVERIKIYEENRETEISNIRNEYQHRIDSLSKVVRNINSEVTRMKRSSIMNY